MPFEFEDGWIVQNDYVRKAYEAGYAAIMWQGKYLLFKVDEVDSPDCTVYEYDTLEELNRMAKLLVET